MVIFTVAFLPLLMTAIPLVMLYSTRGAASARPPARHRSCRQKRPALVPAGLTGADCFQVFLVSQFMMLFMLIPVAIPVTIAAYSIVGEKTTRSLEPLLATPITTLELLVGKCLAAVDPGGAGHVCRLRHFCRRGSLIVTNKALLLACFDVRWLIAIFIVGPLMAVLAVTFSLMVSSRVNDPRVAEQISMLIILPVLAGFFGQVSGLFVMNQQVITVVAVVLFAVDALMVFLATRVFQREAILTRWR